MQKLLLVILLLMPIAGFTQTSYDLPDGTRMQAYLAIPEGLDGQAPLAIVMGGGAGDGRIASGTFESLGQEFVDRGWAVATPVSPNGQSFFAENGEKVRQLITLLKTRDDIADGPVLLGGISNGGISSLQIASSHPDEYLGVVAVPAIANSSSVSNLRDFSVFLRIGSEDQLGWGSRYESTVSALESAGAQVNALLVEGGGHRVPIDWDNLELWLETVK
ncbi:MAG: hypothetical protein P8M72_01185 [Gammaproteobacteria bacterium]|nr:hypothetical protein [Gammaproteobacteria bacterium]